MSRLPVMLSLVLSLGGCAPAPNSSPALAAAGPAADTFYLAMTRYNGCQVDGTAFSSSRSALGRYYHSPTDSVANAFRVISGPNTGLCLPAAVALGPHGEVFVLNRAPEKEWQDSAAGRWQTWVTVYDSAASVNALPVRALHVESSLLSSPSTMFVGPEGKLYLSSGFDSIIDEGSIAVFEPGADGDVAPQRVIAGATTGLSDPGALAIDRHGSVYVANSRGGPLSRLREITQNATSRARGEPASPPPDVNVVRIFAPEADGDVAPSRVIHGDQTDLGTPVDLAVDRQDRLYVANHAQPSITVYVPSATGDAAPVHRFTDERVGNAMGAPEQLALDSHDSVVVRSQQKLTVFGPADTTIPSRSYFRNLPRLFALDSHDTVYVLSDDSVSVFPPGYAGLGPPVRTIRVPRTRRHAIRVMALDRAGGLYLALSDTSVIDVYSRGASGNAAPTRTIQGPRTRLANPAAMALDDDGRLYVANGQRRSRGGNAIRIYAAGARGEDQPVQTVGGPDEALPVATDIAVDSRGDIYLAADDEKTGGRVLIFRRQPDSGYRVARTLAGPSTLLRTPSALAVGRGDTLFVLNAFGQKRYTGFSAFLTNANITVYSPGADGETEPLRTLVVVEDAKNPKLKLPYLRVRYLAVDSTNAVHALGPDGDLVYQSGADGTIVPVLVRLDPRLNAAAGFATVAGDGTVWQAFSPARPDRFPGFPYLER